MAQAGLRDRKRLSPGGLEDLKLGIVEGAELPELSIEELRDLSHPPERRRGAKGVSLSLVSPIGGGSRFAFRLIVGF